MTFLLYTALSGCIAPSSETTFYYGDEGRRSAMRHMMKIIREADTPGSILVSSDDNLDWLPDYINATSKVYYYPRLRDNLYHHATIILPGRCVQSVTVRELQE